MGLPQRWLASDLADHREEFRHDETVSIRGRGPAQN